MKILVTGAAGFIGYHTCKKLLDQGFNVLGIDNLNDYYDPELKLARLKELGIEKVEAQVYNSKCLSSKYVGDFCFVRMDVAEAETLHSLFQDESFDLVCHLAAQAGVRYSLENPQLYIQSNIIGFFNILEACRSHPPKHLVYASSSSVYGDNQEIPFKSTNRVDKPINLYAASKISNELMAHAYTHLYAIPTTGLRFFTVYGPWGRPDMALYLFTEAICKDQPIQVFNQGEMQRDFTYIDDIVEGISKVLLKDIGKRQPETLFRVYNIGNNRSVPLANFIEEIEKNLGKKAKKVLMPLQPGDIKKTWANVDELIKDFNYAPKTDIKKGVKAFVDWYKAHVNNCEGTH